VQRYKAFLILGNWAHALLDHECRKEGKAPDGENGGIRGPNIGENAGEKGAHSVAEVSPKAIHAYTLGPLARVGVVCDGS
jgi:hypothetical protein